MAIAMIIAITPIAMEIIRSDVVAAFEFDVAAGVDVAVDVGATMSAYVVAVE